MGRAHERPHPQIRRSARRGAVVYRTDGRQDWTAGSEDGRVQRVRFEEWKTPDHMDWLPIATEISGSAGNFKGYIGKLDRGREP